MHRVTASYIILVFRGRFALTDDGDYVGQHVSLGEFVTSSEVSEAGRLDLTAVRAAGPVRHQVHAKLTLKVTRIVSIR